MVSDDECCPACFGVTQHDLDCPRRHDLELPLRQVEAWSDRLPRVGFHLGALVATPGAIDTMVRRGIEPLTLLRRHLLGDWGDVDRHDWKVNDRAVRDGYRLLSCYGTDDDRLWVITEADRSSTCILRPDEY